MSHNPDLDEGTKLRVADIQLEENFGEVLDRSSDKDLESLCSPKLFSAVTKFGRKSALVRLVLLSLISEHVRTAGVRPVRLFPGG